jgi:hypothetical protein
VKIKTIAPSRFIHISIALALVSSLLSVFAVPANAVPINPPCETKTTRVGNDTIVQFLRTGTCSWTIPADVTQFRGLIVGGGGGGGGGGLLGGGGGGGGYVEFNSLTIASQSITVTVGAGGSKDPNGEIGATSGGSSSIVSTDAGLNLTAEGGGAGGTFTITYQFFPPAIAPRSGGSGGGSNQTSYGNSTNPLPIIGGAEINPESQTATEIGLSLKGSDGSGACELPDAGPLAAGGGGGAGGVATCVSATKEGQSSFSGNGGIGFQNNILGPDHYWAGGGGGANFVYSDNPNQPVFNGGDGGFGGGGGGGASDQNLQSQPRSSGLDDASGLNPATRASNAGAAVGGNGGANTGGGGGGGSHGGGGGLGGNGGSGIVVLRYSTPISAPAPSSDATLNSATIKGVVATLGTSAATIGSAVAGSVTLPDSVLAGSGVTSFNLSVPNTSGVPEAIVKAVLLTGTNNVEEDFNNGQEYNGETITTGSFFLIKIISQDGTSTSYYQINIVITDTTSPIISVDPTSVGYLYQGTVYVADSDIVDLELPTATATDNIDGPLTALTLAYVANGITGSCQVVNDLETIKSCLNYVGNYVDFTFTAQDAASNSATQTIRIKSVPGDSPILTYREPIFKGDVEPEVKLDISGSYQYAGISFDYTGDETEYGEFSSEEFFINTFETGLRVKRINSTDDGDVHIFFYGPATGPGRVTVRAYAPAFLHSFPEEDSNLLSIPIICDGATVACEVGDTGPGGGTIFYVESNPAGFTSAAPECTAGCKYLEAANTSGYNSWADLGPDDLGFVWSSNDTSYIELTDTAIGSGYGNTQIMLEIGGGGTTGAASAATGYLGGGKTDWYLPSIAELEQLHLSNVANINGAYWSSSEAPCSSNDCGLKAQSSGGSDGEYESGDNLKTDPYKVRPIRAFGAIVSNEVNVPCTGGGSFTVVGTSVQSSSIDPQCAGSVVIPNGVIEVSDNAFAGRNSITSVTIPNSVETIGFNAFNSMQSLISVTMGNGVRTIGGNAFGGLSSLRSLIIPEGVRFIGAFAFEEDYRLETLVIPSTVESIGSGAFDGTLALRSFKYCGTRLGRQDFIEAGLGNKEILPCVSAPSAPTSIDVLATGKRSAKVTITNTASNGGSAITSYTITASPGGLIKSLPVSGNVSSLVYEFTNLQPGTRYTFSVTAANAVGTSSATSSNAITTVSLVVASITTLSYSDDGTGSAGKLVWTGKHIESVLFTGPVKIYPGPFNYGAFTSAWNGTIRNLTPETTYTISLAVVSEDGLGESKSLTFTTSVKAEVVKDLAYWNTWLKANTFMPNEADNLNGLLNKFNAIDTSPYRSYIKVPTSRVSTVNVTSLTPNSCSVVSATAKADAGLVKALSKDTCTISYTVMGPSKAPATLVRDFVFKKVG